MEDDATESTKQGQAIASSAADQMDFTGWNSDVESSLLDRASNDNDSSWDETMNEWTELTTFPTGSVDAEPQGKAGIGIAKEQGSSHEPSRDGIGEHENMSLPSSKTRDGVASVTESSDRSSLEPKLEDLRNITAEPNAPGLHPQAIQSSAMCPPHGKILPPNYEHIYPAPSQQEWQAVNIYEMNLRLMAAGGGVSALPSMQNMQQSSDASSAASSLAQYQNQQTSILSSLANNFRLAQQCGGGGGGAAASTPSNASPPSPAPLTRGRTPNNKRRSKASSQRQSNAYVSASTSESNSRTSSSLSQQQQAKNKKEPPFLLFDAPLELRTSFNQNQRRLGMPVKHDCNSYHYGESVKGFHPQHLGVINDIQIGFPPRKQLETMVKLIDARHGPQATSGRIKNVREQKRAQKITELIDQLGDIMKEGGWNVETKSKYQTLSSCTEYMRHLIKTKGQKEEAVKKLKQEVDVRKQRMEEDKTAQDGRSDLESITSSLTSSTTWSSRVKTNKLKAQAPGAAHHHHNHHHKNKNNNQISRNMSSASSGDSSGFSTTNGGPNQTFCIDKTEASVSDLTDSNRGSSSNNSGSGGSGSGGSGTRTGSGAGSGTESGSGGSGNGGTGSKGSASTEREPALGGAPQEAGVEDEDERTTSSISSDAAVASQKSSHDRHSELPQHNQMDVVFNTRKRKDRTNPPEAVTSTERSFKLDYEEVFDQSNIPQLIAGTSGKIVSWNQSFVNATGLEESDLERMTIFSLVQQDKLSSFFEIAATALRSGGDEGNDEAAVTISHKDSRSAKSSSQETTSQDESQTSSASSEKKNNTNNKNNQQRKWNYDALTLPCIEFPAMKERRESSSKWDTIDTKLNMTMILITDPNPRKRCFHCTFTDCPGTDGTLGIITPDLLAVLYSNPEKLNLEQHPHYRRKHKRAKIQAAAATIQKPSNDK